MQDAETLQKLEVPHQSGSSRHWVKAYRRLKSHLDYLQADTFPKDPQRLAYIKGFEEAVTLFERTAAEPYFKRRGNKDGK